MNTTNNNDDLLNDDPEQSSRRNITKSDDMPEDNGCLLPLIHFVS